MTARPQGIPRGTALHRLLSGEPIDALEAKRDTLRELMIDFETALDEAEQREARIDRRRRARATTPDAVGRGQSRGGAA